MWPSFRLQSGEYCSGYLGSFVRGLWDALVLGCPQPFAPQGLRLHLCTHLGSFPGGLCELMRPCSYSKSIHVDRVPRELCTGLQGCPEGASPASGRAAVLTDIGPQALGWQARYLPLMM